MASPVPVPVGERFWSKVAMLPGGCWPWTAARRANGYGMINGGGGKMRSAHRVAYELAVGPIPDGLQIDHLCRNRACVNPYHLEAVTQLENVRRGYSARRTARDAKE